MDKRTKSSLFGKKVVVTGKLKHYTRNALMVLLKDIGASPTYQISSKTDILVVGANPGQKLRKAQLLGVRILPEAEFEVLLSQLTGHSRK